jgi:predicted permease
MDKLLRRIQFLLGRNRIEAELAEEMEFHREMLAREHEGDRAAANRALGNVTLAREDARGIWLLPWIESLWQDLAYGLRGLRRQPGFTLVAVAALAIAIGLNTSLFTVFNAVAFRPWPVKDPARVVSVNHVFRKGPEQGRTSGFGVAEWRYLSGHAKSFRGLILTGGGEPVDLQGNTRKMRWVTGNFFSVLGIDMARGRGFLAEEDDYLNPQAVAVVSYATWQNQFGGAPDIVGQTLRFDDVAFTVVGVAPEGFVGTAETANFWAPFSSHLLLRPHDTGYKDFLTNPEHCCVSLAGRLAPDVTRDRAAAEVDLLMRQFHDNRPQEGAPVVIVTGTALLEAHPGDRAKVLPVMGAMFAAMTLVLLLACANVGNLLLARAASRQTEIAVRLSLGGTRMRLIRQLLVESAALALIASAAGLAIAATGPRMILPRVSADLALLTLSPDWRVCAYAVALAVIACLAFGLAPALHGTRGNIAAAIKRDSSMRGSRLALRSILLATQVAISVVLLAGAGLLVRGLQAARHRDPGYRLDGVTLATLNLPASAYGGGRRAVFTSTLRDALEHDAGLPHVGLTSDAPMSNSRSWTHMRASDRPQEYDRTVQTHEVSAAYFDVLAIPVVEGRNFTRDDSTRALILLNQNAAARTFPGVSAIGRHVIGGGKDYEVVGVVKDAFTTSLGAVEPAMYRPMSGHDDIPQLLVADSMPATLERISAIVRGLEPRARIAFAPLADNFKVQLEPAQYAAALAGALGLLALTLASIGMAGVFAYVVRQRTREIGIRMALGADARQVVRLVLASNLRPLVFGLAVGVAGAVAAMRMMKSMLYGVSPIDPIAYAGVFALLIAAAAAASALPARRAARVDPVTALRWE